MDFVFKPLTIADVQHISKWTYKGYMKSIYMEPYFENYKKNGLVKGPLQCDGYGVYASNQLMGLFEYYWKGNILEIGLALHPDYIGKGYSNAYIDAGINFGLWHYDYQEPYIQLSVDKQNLAAIRAYIKNGFIEDHQTNDEIIMHKYV